MAEHGASYSASSGSNLRSNSPLVGVGVVCLPGRGQSKGLS